MKSIPEQNATIEELLAYVKQFDDRIVATGKWWEYVDWRGQVYVQYKKNGRLPDTITELEDLLGMCHSDDQISGFVRGNEFSQKYVGAIFAKFNVLQSGRQG